EERAARGGRRGGDPGMPTADDEHVAVSVARVVPTRATGHEPALPRERDRPGAVFELDERRTEHRLRTDPNGGVRPLLVRREAPARPVAVDAAEAAEHAVSHQRGCKGLALSPLVLDAVEAEPHVANSFVDVSRTTSNQRRQPCLCTQRSRSGPFGLARTNRNSDHSVSDSAAGSAG